MELDLKKRILFFAGRGSIEFAKKAVTTIGQKLSKVEIKEFSDGEIEPHYVESVRGAYVFIILSTNSAKNIIELGLMIDAAKKASAAQVIAVIPYFGYARQDKKGKPRVAIGAKFIANILEKAAGVDSIVTMDLHSDQIEGFFDIPVTHIFASKVYVDYVKNNLDLTNVKFATADTGGIKRSTFYSNYFNLGQAVAHKTRIEDNKVESVIVIGDVEGYDIVIFEDIIDTGGTICKAAQAYFYAGAKSVRVVATHPVFSGEAIYKINNSVIKEVIITDTIALSDEAKKCAKFIAVSAAPLFGQVMLDIAHNRSISGNLVKK